MTRRLWYPVACALLSAASALAQTTVAQETLEPRWREADSWRQPQGLPQDTVFSIAQSRDGYMWVGTRGGLARFDGVRFTTFDDRGKDPLREIEIWALLAEDDGSLWVGTYGGGLARLVNGRFSVFTTKDGLVNNFVRNLARDASGALWIGTDAGLSRFEHGRFTNFTVEDGLSHKGVRSLHADPDGAVWIATKSGIDTVRAGRIVNLTFPEPRPTAVIDAVHRDRQGALWVGTQEGLFRFAGGRTTRYTMADGLSSNSVRTLFEDSRGRLWIATDDGLDRYAGPSSALPIVKEALLRDIRSLGEDREGSLWAGCEGRGLTRFYEGLFAVYTEANGLPSADVRTVLDDGRGNRWIGTAKGLSVLRAGTISSLGRPNGLPNAPVDALAEDREGNLWVGTEVGLFRSSDARCSPPSCLPHFLPLRNDTIPAMHVRVLRQDSAGALWVGTNLEGLARYQHGRFTTYTTKDGLSSDSIRAFAEDREGVLWIGTKGGLDRIEDGKFVAYGKRAGIPGDGVQALYMDPRGTLWIAGRYGLGRYKDARFTTYTAKDGLYDSHAYGIVEDDLGNLWMSCAKGIFRVSKKQLDDFAEGRIKSITSVAYGREHGLPSTMSAVGVHPAGIKSQRGRIWFATRGGLAVVNPKTLSTNTVAPPVLLEQVHIDGRAFDLDGPADAPPGDGDLVFRYTALSFLAPEKVRFKYKLEGFDRDWVDADTRRVAYYTNLPPARYRFRVIASNNDGVWNETGAAVQLRLAPHIYQTYWFYGLCALTLAFAGAATQRLRVRRGKLRELELSARVEQAVAQVKVLSGLLPICASCKKIRDDTGYWSQMETYIHDHSEAEFSHGICPDCSEKLYPGVAQKARDRKAAATLAKTSDTPSE